MKKTSTSEFKVTITANIITMCIMVIFYACTKNSAPLESPKTYHEFTIPKDNVDKRLAPLMDSLQKMEDQKPFMDKAIDNLGSPLWEYAILERQHGILTVVAPMAKKGSSKVTGLIALKNDGKFRFRFFDAAHPEKYGFNSNARIVNARSVFIVADLFNQRAFDQDPAAINDPCMMTRLERAYINEARMADGGKKLTLSTRGFVGLIETCYYTTVCIGDGAGNCIGEVTVHRDCVFSSIWIDDSGIGDPEYGPYSEDVLYPTGGSGTGQAPSYSNDCDELNDQEGQGSVLAVFPPAKPITDVSKYLNCFSPNRGAIISFFADQPLAGSTDLYSMKEKVGHAFLTIEQFENGRVIRRTVGFHPSGAVSPFLAKSSESQLGDDSNEPYDVRLDVSVTPAKVELILNLIQNYNPTYHIENYNCTNFVLDIADACGLQINRTKGSWVVGSGLNPANFGEDLKKVNGAVTGSGKSKENSGSCN